MKRIVVLTGAGISAESGIPTFRDSNGLWENYRIEDVATPQAWASNPALVLDFYNQRRRGVQQAQPNAGHLSLVDIEKHFELHIITQNIDDLHERAGSKNVLHLHGEILKSRSTNNWQPKIYNCTGDILIGDKCEDGYQLRPHIVWFGEEVPMIETASHLVSQADVLMVVGTSMQVYPAAGLVNYAPSGVPVYVIDKKIPEAAELNPDWILIEEAAGVGVQKAFKLLLQK